MKRYILTFIITLLFAATCFAQSKIKDNLGMQYLKNAFDTELDREGYELLSGRKCAGLMFKNNDPLDRFKSNSISASTNTIDYFWVDCDANIDVIATLINSKNAEKFHYRVIKNDEIISGGWLSVNKFRKTKTGLEYAYLGNFNFKNSELRIQIEQKDNYYNKEEFVINNTPIKKPLYINAFLLREDVDGKKSEFIEIYKQGYNNKPDIKEYDQVKRDARGKLIGFNYSNRIQVIKAEVYSLTDTYNYFLYLIHEDGKKLDTVKIQTERNEPLYIIDKKYIRESGKYTALVVPEFIDGKRFFEKSTAFSFEVFPPANSKRVLSLSTGELILILMVLTGIGLIIWLLFRRNKLKLAVEKQNKEKVLLELKAIHSQLNPHFIFNALSSIQNLVNQNNLSKANEYLTTFSTLTRQVLSNKEELISVEEELKMLNSYLKMEQLRFGFQYEIKADPTLDVINIEIPTMLLQPFVENAIKHGIASKGAEGMVAISIGKEAEDVILTVKDNGAGFDEKQINGTSMGIKLCKDRIELLNKLHADAPVFLNISSNVNGTLVKVTLKDWA
ncbi:sensor histidine kinase [Solitalea koreensis]|uniref:Histidine kinase n=1 Tax=Solitalea koreensis TaxID=543615 RepID=A0A521BRG3_9SPHI|nr:histidine kinase [Solitalea koreensis]SMO49746.1 Histidine kinase [Solitalea koreensis]